MARDENDDILPDQDAAKEFYAKYEPKEVLGRWSNLVIKNTLSLTCYKLWISLYVWYVYRGISSTVRRCVEKETGREYAAKIIDLSNEDNNTHTVRESTLSEVHILRLVAGHPYISEYL